jgi:two-component system NarL family response regulator/two-component system nitrate/nitrite response regulator NarL
MSISVVLVDDHPLMLAGLEQLLAGEPDFDVRAVCGSVEEGWKALEEYHPDVVVLDLKLGTGDGLEILRRLEPSKGPAVIVLTAVEDEDVWLTAARLGAKAVVLKATAPRVLEDCVRSVYRGESWLTVGGIDLSKRLAQRDTAEAELGNSVTPRELEVVRLVALGLDNQEIAARLAISVGTVKIHLHHVYDKLQLKGRSDLIRFLRESGY